MDDRYSVEERFEKIEEDLLRVMKAQADLLEENRQRIEELESEIAAMHPEGK